MESFKVTHHYESQFFFINCKSPVKRLDHTLLNPPKHCSIFFLLLRKLSLTLQCSWIIRVLSLISRSSVQKSPQYKAFPAGNSCCKLPLKTREDQHGFCGVFSIKRGAVRRVLKTFLGREDVFILLPTVFGESLVQHCGPSQLTTGRWCTSSAAPCSIRKP